MIGDLMKNVLNYFAFNISTKLKAKKKIKQYGIITPKNINTKYKSMYLLCGYTFLNDIINYYNEELALTACICTSLHYSSKTEKKICYHLENFYFRLISCWDYIFIGLNEYLQTELIASRDIKEKIIEENLSLNIPVENEEGYFQIYKIPLSEDERKEKEKKLKKELTVLTPSNLKIAIRNKYEMNEYITKIFEIYNTEQVVQQAKVIRNTIIHSDSLAKNFNFTVSDIFGGQVISSKEFDDTIKKIGLVSINMEMLKKAINLLNEMITLDLFPNRIEDKSKQYFVQMYTCKDCKKEYVYPSDYIETLTSNPFCSFCDSDNTEYVETEKVSQPYYEQVLIKFIEDTKDYLEQEISVTGETE